MDLSVGVDCEDISRFDGITNNKNLMRKIFTDKEINYCMSKAKPARHFAVRFAGKEALIKAINGSGEKVYINQIEILNEKSGLPLVNFLDKDMTSYRVKLSLSHSKKTAVAFAVVVPQ
ncbi:MAG: holo-ACP synthase [Candidatus Hydrothermarchaeaceae archaeon]